MNADAYLKRHGWRGTGHSLDHTDRGIKKPLLIAHKQDQLGLGKKKAAHSVSDQWWMRAFDESLQNIGTGQESTLSQVRKQGINRGGLYSFFVKGQGLTGTILEESSTADTSQSDSSTPPSRASTPATTASEASEESSSSSDSESTSDEDMSTTEEFIPIPTEGTNKRKRKDKAQAKEAQKKQKLEEADDMEGDELSRKKQRAVHGVDPPTEQDIAIRRRIDHQVKNMIKAKILNGEFGVVLPQPSHKGAPKKVIVEDPTTGKKVSYKKAKFEREEKSRHAKHQLKKTLIVDAMMDGDLPNPKDYTREEALTNFDRDEKLWLKEEKKRSRALTEQRKQQKAEVRKARIEAREKDKAEKRELKKQERALNGADETPKDEADRFHSHRAKKERKLAAQAGLSVQAYRAKLELEKNQEAIAAKIAKLSEQEKAQYEERAAKKSQSLDEYVLRRIQKKETQRAEQDVERDSGKAGEQPSMFFTDLEGDVNLLAKVAPGHIEPKKLPYELNPDGSVPLDPTIWQDRPVKSLSKDERAARLQYLRNRRYERGVASGKIKPGEAPQLSRAAKKTKSLQSLTGKILSEELGIKEGATKEQKNLARRMAKKLVRDEKKEHKRGKTNKLTLTKKTSTKISEATKEKNRLVALALSNATAV